MSVILRLWLIAMCWGPLGTVRHRSTHWLLSRRLLLDRPEDAAGTTILCRHDREFLEHQRSIGNDL